MGNAYQVLAQDPTARMRYDLLGMFTYMVKLSGFRRIDDFKYTPEQVQQNVQMMQANAATNPAATNATTGPQQNKHTNTMGSAMAAPSRRNSQLNWLQL